jgi:hypothetical protein
LLPADVGGNPSGRAFGSDLFCPLDGERAPSEVSLLINSRSSAF